MPRHKSQHERTDQGFVNAGARIDARRYEVSSQLLQYQLLIETSLLKARIK